MERRNFFKALLGLFAARVAKEKKEEPQAITISWAIDDDTKTHTFNVNDCWFEPEHAEKEAK